MLQAIAPLIAPSSSELPHVLVAQIHKFLDLFLHDNATFLAERLVALDTANEDHIHLLATCYYRASKASRAITVLQNCANEQNRYLLALCYYETRQLLNAKTILLMGTDALESGPIVCQKDLAVKIPNGAAGLYLLGGISKQDQCHDHAIEYFRLCLQTDPYFWLAFEALCDLGAEVSSDAVFNPHAVDQDKSKDFMSPSGNQTMDLSTDGGVSPSKSNQIEMNNQIYPRRSSNSSRSNKKTSKNDSNSTKKVALRQSARLSSISSAMKEQAQKQPFQSQNSPNNKGIDQENKTKSKSKKNHLIQTKGDSPPSLSSSGHGEAMELFSLMGEAYQHLTTFQCQDALILLKKLPLEQLETGWTRCQIGRAYFEMCKYEEARREFVKMRKIAPQQMEGLEIYSTVLWHLQKDKALCFLAQEIADYEKFSCEVWCVIGNCFSRQKEHETALKFFKRAIQINPSFTYAHTLSGHEYVSNEDFEKATAYYQKAIHLNPRHYNAWYGMGTIYYRQEKFRLAEYHFQRALKINSRSSLLYCYLGMVLLSCNKHEDALSMLARATELQPENPQARFQRANVLIAQDRNEEALQELLVVRNHAPRESSVHFLMGKVCKKMNLIDEAMHHYTNALYFNPKDNNVIKMAIDRLNGAEEDENDGI